MGKVYSVNNLNEAIALAKEFKSTGKYNLFRGQGLNWEVKSTFARLRLKEFEFGMERLVSLYNFMEKVNSLKKYISDIDWFFAVAQHYQIPTNYIDFTYSIEVASYFATNSKSNVLGKECVIICLLKDDFNDFIQLTNSIYEKDKVVAPYIVSPNVDNLWRLQSQQGCFLFSPYSNIEKYYDFDRILFPYTEPYSEISINTIYPENKSELEILLDHYFNLENSKQKIKMIEKFVRKMNIPIHQLTSFDFSNRLKNTNPHPSWNKKNIIKWSFKFTEVWGEFEQLNIQIFLDKNKNFDIQLKDIIQQLSNIVTRNRYSSISFDFISQPTLKLALKQTLAINCSRIWNGTRNLPYSDNEINNMISKYICLEFYRFNENKVYSFTKEKLILLEITNESGSVTKCWASPSEIILAFREDLKEVLTDELTQNISSEILLYINKPIHVFNFLKLIALFKEELIVYQVLLNSHNNKPVIFFTPTQVNVIGYA